MILETLKKYQIFVFVIVINIVLFFIRPEISQNSFANSFQFFLEVLKILPPIMVLMGLLDIWVSRETIESHLGVESGFKGSILSILLGTAAAGPLFAAFPVAISLQKKGARTANMIIFLGSWAAIKIPMLLIESSFIGVRFAILRLVITIPFILGIGYLMEKMLGSKNGI